MTTAIDEIARLTVRVQALEADLLAAEADLKAAEAECSELQERWDRHAIEAECEADERARTAVAEFVADVRRGIRDLNEFEAVFA
jgi:hypothetical protein